MEVAQNAREATDETTLLQNGGLCAWYPIQLSYLVVFPCRLEMLMFSSCHFHTDAVVPCSDHCCIETVLPSSDHYSTDIIVVPSSDHCYTETVPPSSDH